MAWVLFSKGNIKVGNNDYLKTKIVYLGLAQEFFFQDLNHLKWLASKGYVFEFSGNDKDIAPNHP